MVDVILVYGVCLTVDGACGVVWCVYISVLMCKANVYEGLCGQQSVCVIRYVCVSLHLRVFVCNVYYGVYICIRVFVCVLWCIYMLTCMKDQWYMVCTGMCGVWSMAACSVCCYRGCVCNAMMNCKHSCVRECIYILVCSLCTRCVQQNECNCVVWTNYDIVKPPADLKMRVEEFARTAAITINYAHISSCNYY
jgi:hypothetical protein